MPKVKVMQAQPLLPHLLTPTILSQRAISKLLAFVGLSPACRLITLPLAIFQALRTLPQAKLPSTSPPRQAARLDVEIGAFGPMIAISARRVHQNRSDGPLHAWWDEATGCWPIFALKASLVAGIPILVWRSCEGDSLPPRKHRQKIKLDPAFPSKVCQCVLSPFFPAPAKNRIRNRPPMEGGSTTSGVVDHGATTAPPPPQGPFHRARRAPCQQSSEKITSPTNS